ncbi:hypothetical protein [Streptomyces sedi]|uniref:Uncharacterized protein n=1 Tax=Streptomyces sedi TaxID=555059 RepID=A0A5C4URI8_9ACTN|nr:hypothetical protein [Streptomyces sedi]TNM25923.1 hypothetical protein FH715_25515 [Streptomyces sedi]
MNHTYSVDDFLVHSEHCAQKAEDLLDLDWDEHWDIAVRVYLLDRWLREDDSGRLAVSTALRVDQEDVGLETDDLEDSGLFRGGASDGAPWRIPRGCRSVPVAVAASTVGRAVLAGGEAPSSRVALLAENLRETIAAVAEEAVLVTVEDPATGALASGETHVVLRGTLWATPAIRVSVIPRVSSVSRIPGEPHTAGSGEGRGEGGLDPACVLVGCALGARLAPEEHRLAEGRTRAVCAGTVLAALQECDGRAAFKVDWRPHGIEPGRHDDPVAVRAWWEKTTWRERYTEDHVEIYYDYGAGDWIGKHTHLAPTAEELAALDGEHAEEAEDDWLGARILDLGEPGETPVGSWILGEPMSFLGPHAFSAEVEALRRTLAAGLRDGELSAALLEELLIRPVARVGGSQHQVAVWADADEDGAFWPTFDGGLDRYEDARRLLVVGPTEALYIVFRGEMGE